MWPKKSVKKSKRTLLSKVRALSDRRQHEFRREAERSAKEEIEATRRRGQTDDG
jgi:hypothetical protein